MSAPMVGRRLKIAVLNRGFFSRAGGAERYSISLAEMLAARHEVHVFAQHLDHDHPDIIYHRIPQCVRRPSWINLLCYNFRTWRATRADFDIVHSHENTWHGNVQTAHVRPVKVGLFVGRTGWRRWQRYLQIATSPRLWVYLLIERARFAPRPGKRVIATSEPLRAELENAYPSLRGRTEVLPPGVHAVQPTDAAERTRLRQSLQLADDAFVLLFVGNDYGKKGLGPLLEALATLPPEVALVVVGNPAHIPEYRARAESLAVAGRVRFAGGAADVAPYYRLADALVHPTTEDTFAMVVLEALSHGLPVVVSGPVWCGIAASLTDGENALILSDPRVAEEIVKAVVCLRADARLCQMLAVTGRAFANRYAWGELTQRQEMIYIRALSEKKIV